MIKDIIDIDEKIFLFLNNLGLEKLDFYWVLVSNKIGMFIFATFMNPFIIAINEFKEKVYHIDHLIFELSNLYTGPTLCLGCHANAIKLAIIDKLNAEDAEENLEQENSTNLDWELKEDVICSNAGLKRLELINDFCVLIYGLPFLNCATGK